MNLNVAAYNVCLRYNDTYIASKSETHKAILFQRDFT